MLIVLVESYKFGNYLLLSPFLVYDLIRRMLWEEGEVEDGRLMSPWQKGDLILPPILSLQRAISSLCKLCICS